jgi:hypothetical protein
MADAPENHTLRLLREMREEQTAFRSEVTTPRGEVTRRFDELDIAVAALSTDLEVTKNKVGSTGDRLENIEGLMMERRLGRIETHTGMVKA